VDKASLINLAYLLAAVLFIFGLKGLTHPRTAVRGNLLGALGMLVAIVATLFHDDIISYRLIVLGLVIGGAVGATLALTVRMTAMPQMVALLNGFGGGASTLVAWAELVRESPASGSDVAVATMASGLIGAVTFWGSLVAFAKLQEYKAFKEPFRYPAQTALNGLLAAIVVAVAAWGAMVPSPAIYLLLVLLASVLGVTLVNPIGGADMPVVIALLNSYSGLAACATGFVLSNTVLIIAGSLVGASGLILTSIMCKAMNRSLGGRIKATSAEEVAMLFDTAQRVVIVPGYGMAVAQAQHAVRDLANLLESRGVEVEFAIHPVAGRMPGHMNVLLAEAEVPYEKLKEPEQINPAMAQTD